MVIERNKEGESVREEGGGGREEGVWKREEEGGWHSIDEGGWRGEEG